MSHLSLAGVKHHGQVLVNGEPFLLKNRIKPGDHISLSYPPQQTSKYLEPQYLPLDM